jgi:rubredoxin
MSEINLGGTQPTQTNQNSPLEPKVQNKAQQLAQEHNIPEQFIDTEFQVPTDYVQLPSGGMFYPNRKSSVQIKYLTAEEENILTSADLIKSGKVLDVLLKKAIIDKDIDPEELLSSDRNAVLIALRITGYGDEYEAKTTCPMCSHVNKNTVLLSSLQNRDVADTPDSEGLFSVQLPKCKANIKFRLLKGSDETRLQKVAELNKKSVGNNMKYQTVLTERYLLQIMEVQGNRDKTFIKKFISAMPIADSLFFREYLKEVEPGLDMNHDFDCESCGHSYQQEIPMTAKLFWPNANI